MGRHSMGEFEHLVMLAALRIGPDAYGVSIIEEIEARTGRDVSQSAAYLTLKRLEEKGWLAGRQEAGDDARGRRERRCFELTEEGLRRIGRSSSATWRNDSPIGWRPGQSGRRGAGTGGKRCASPSFWAPAEWSAWWRIVGSPREPWDSGLRASTSPSTSCRQKLRGCWPGPVRAPPSSTYGTGTYGTGRWGPLDPHLPLQDVLTLEETLRRGHGAATLFMSIFVTLGGVTLLMALVGLHGVHAFTLSGRIQEIGVRRAFGARRGQVIAQAMRSGLRPVWLGLLLGLPPGVMVATTVVPLESSVHGWLLVPPLLLLAASLQVWWPTWKASLVQPTEALREL